MGKKDSKDEKGKGMWLMLIYTKEESDVWSYWCFNKIGERKLLGFNEAMKTKTYTEKSK